MSHSFLALAVIGAAALSATPAMAATAAPRAAVTAATYQHAENLVHAQLPSTPPPAGDTYAEGFASICNDGPCTKWQVIVDYHVTYNGSNVWLNGNPSSICGQVGTRITWCGVGDNGRKTLGLGANFGTNGQYYFRVYVNGDGSCTFGANLGVLEGWQCPDGSS